MSTGTDPATAITATSASTVGDHIRQAIERGYGLVPRSSTGTARHGRGAAGAGTRLLDLSNLDGVPLVSARERVAVVEAGVTFSGLEPLLEAEGLRLCHPLLPPAGKSVVASLMDREPQLIPKYHWDFTDPLLCAELWFGTGDRFRTGSAAGPGASLEEQWRAGMFQKNPLGPAQTDLVKLAQGAQGSLGIATWASVRLERRPEIRLWLVAGAETLAPLAHLVACLTRRRIGDELLLFDRQQVAQLTGALHTDPPAAGSSRWVLIFSIGSLPRRPEASIAYQLDEARALAGTAGVALHDVTGTSGEGFAVAVTRATAPMDDWKHHAAGSSREIAFLTTVDRAGPLIQRVRDSWASFAGDDAVGTYLQPVNQGRTCHVEVTAFVDGHSAGEMDARSAGLARDLAGAGAFFSRPIGPAVPAAYERCGDVVRTLHKVKRVLDPHGVLSPGALCFDPGIATRAFEEVPA